MRITPAIAETVRDGGLGIMPTDTIYGIVCSAANQRAVNRLFKLKKRTSRKPPVVIISEIEDLSLLEIKLSPKHQQIAEAIWPGPFSLILPIHSARFKYLHDGHKSMAVRLPRAKWLTNFIKKTGPLATSSVNYHNEPPATSIKMAKRYFGDKVDFYLDAGTLGSKPSTIISLEQDKPALIRQGIGKIPKTIKLNEQRK